VPNETDIISCLSEKIVKIERLYEQLEQKNKMLSKMYDDKVGENGHLKAEMERYKKLYENLVLAKSLSLSDEQRMQAKRSIDQIIREINRSLTLIK
jgi:hypothetical protein